MLLFLYNHRHPESYEIRTASLAAIALDPRWLDQPSRAGVIEYLKYLNQLNDVILATHRRILSSSGNPKRKSPLKKVAATRKRNIWQKTF